VLHCCLEAEEENEGDLDRIGVLITELIMWKDVSKSSFWFGFGSLCFLSSCFTKGFNFRSATFFIIVTLSFVMYSGKFLDDFVLVVVSASSLLSHNWQFCFWLFRFS
jgi:hypothetical protein